MKPQITLLLLLALLIAAAPSAGAAQPAASYQLFLPNLAAGAAPPSVFGVEAARVDAPGAPPALAALQLSWLRRNSLRWSEIEPVENGGYRWDGPATRALEADMVQAARLGLNLILIVHGSPAWAVTPGTGSCGPIAPAKQAAFERFLSAAVARYSRAPFYVRYWEIGNEPDGPQTDGALQWGCWGDPADPYYGGRAYGALLKRAYQAVKAADPRSQVFNGGLLLDRPYDRQTGDGRSARFLEGMLEAGAGGSFDMLAYHSYSHYDGTPDGVLGAADWKPAYLRGLLARYGVSRPLINTESALLCATATPACVQAQAFAVPRMYARAMRDDLRGLIWYLFDSDSFRNTALVEPTAPATPRPAYAAYLQARTALAGQRYLGPVTGLPAGVEGYRFSSGGRVTIVLWANTPRAVQLALGPAAALRCAEWDGAAFLCAAPGGALSVEARPGARYISYGSP